MDGPAEPTKSWGMPRVTVVIDEKTHLLPAEPGARLRDVLLAAQPTKEFVTTEQIGDMAVFLCSDAGSAINGAMLQMDGGWVAQ